MLYRWNQIDPSSAAILKTLVLGLCPSLAGFYFGWSHPHMVLTTGLCIGVLLGQAIPPRLSLRRLVITLLALAVFGSLLAVFHW
jgi:hypothetical protein